MKSLEYLRGQGLKQSGKNIFEKLDLQTILKKIFGKKQKGQAKFERSKKL